MLYLADKSALQRARKYPPIGQLVSAFGDEGLLATCYPVALELGVSARSAAEWDKLAGALKQQVWLETNAEVQKRAWDVQRRLADDGHHRAPSPVDLLIAATAELNDAAVLHYDKDYDLIAAVTRQPAHWVVPRGTAG